MNIGGLGLNSLVLTEISNMRKQMTDLQQQLGSGKVADTYGGLGDNRTMALSLRQEMDSIGSYQDNIGLARTRVEIAGEAVDQMRTHAVDTRSELLVGGFEVLSEGQTVSQMQAGARLADTVDLLNTEVAGRYLFGGTKTDETPVVSPTEFLDGAGSKAGFKQVMNERLQADLGSDGRGRLDITASAADTVSLAEDFAGSPFGFKLGSVNSTLSGTTVTGPAGSPPNLDVAFSSTLPTAGEKIQISLTLPDGTSKELTLTAADGPDLEDGEFGIGADAASTASSFQLALTQAIETEAATTLSAASMEAAANDFFVSGSDIPQRVDGPPFDTATGLRDATDTDTVRWYKGQISDESARESALVRVDDNQLVAYGARADEEAFTTLVKQLSIMSSSTYDQDTDGDYERYTAMTDRVSDNLGYSVKSQSLERVIGEFAVVQSSLGNAEERHTSTDNMLTNFLAQIETADTNEVGVKLLSLQTQLQASYQVTSMLSNLSLVNYL